MLVILCTHLKWTTASHKYVKLVRELNGALPIGAQELLLLLGKAICIFNKSSLLTGEIVPIYIYR